MICDSNYLLMGTLREKSFLEVSVMRYPAWFPYPSCWFKALILGLSWIPIFWVNYVIFCWGGATVLVLSSHHKIDLILLIIWISSMGVAVPVFLLSHIHQFLWSDPNPKFPRWLPNLKSLGEGFWGWFVMISCITLTVLLIILPYRQYCIYHYDGSYSCYQYRPLTGKEVALCNTIWMILAAYFYYVRHYVVKWLNPFMIKVNNFFHWLKVEGDKPFLPARKPKKIKEKP